MRIVHTVADYRDTGGISTYIHMLVEAQREVGHEVLVASRRGEFDCRLDEIESISPDVVHMHDSSVLPDFSECAVVRSLHNYDFGCSTGERFFDGGTACVRPHGPGCIANWPRCSHTARLDRLVSRYRSTSRELHSLANIQGLIVYSTFVKRAVVANGLDETSVRVIPCPAPRFALDADYASSNRGRVTYVGRLSGPKGVDVLIRAASMLADVELRVVGEGYQESRLRELAYRVAPGRVTFVPWKSGKSLWDEYLNAAIVAMPGRWPEPFGLVGLEAAWAGRPVVASASGGVLDWLVDGETGLLVKPGSVTSLAEGISTILDDPKLALAMSKEARRLASTWPGPIEHAKAVLSLYDDVLS